MKKLFQIDESEKSRIIEMHSSATKRMYLSELGEQEVATATRNNPTTTGPSSLDYLRDLAKKNPGIVNDAMFKEIMDTAKRTGQPSFSFSGKTYDTSTGKVLSTQYGASDVEGLKKEIAQLKNQIKYTDYWTRKAQDLLGMTGNQLDGKFGEKTFQILQNTLTKLKTAQEMTPVDVQPKQPSVPAASTETPSPQPVTPYIPKPTK